ncbi:PqiC family protein [Alteromonas sp. A079]|uniref:PqiC family protein n=1 Tax=Alteromonas sp. A079 TaxID=3410268 RepID=UPI003BA2B564
MTMKLNYHMFQQRLTARAALRSLIFFTALGVSACSSTDKSLNLYLLHTVSQAPVESPNENNEVARQLLVLNELQLPHYLKQPGLVYQTSGTGIHVSTEHFWGEPLEEGLTKLLRDTFASQNIRMTQPPTTALKNDVQLSIRIDDFIATWQGDIVLRGAYSLQHSDNTTEAPSITEKRFYIKQALQSDGFAASVQSMRLAINALVMDISNDVTASN